MAAELAAAVVAQAFADACPGERSLHGKRGLISTRGVKIGGSMARAEAWWFLTDTTGIWAEARVLWCSITGVEPEVIRAEAIRRGPNEACARELAALAQRQAAARDRRAEDALVAQIIAAQAPAEARA